MRPWDLWPFCTPEKTPTFLAFTQGRPSTTTGNAFTFVFLILIFKVPVFHSFNCNPVLSLQIIRECQDFHSPLDGSLFALLFSIKAKST